VEIAPKEKPFSLPPFAPQVITVVGYIVSAIVGLGLGYLILMFLRPELPRPW
jgi:hypothetical protein